MSDSNTAHNEDAQTEQDNLQAHEMTMLLRNAYFSIRRQCNSTCNDFGCNGDQFVILNELSRREGVTQQDLVKRTGYDPATTGKMLRLLEQRGLVERKDHPTDGRAKFVTLTGQGRETWHQLWTATSEIRDVLWSSVPESDRSVFVRSLVLIARSMEG